MESVLALICIVFFVILTYGFIEGANIDRFHIQSCRTIYVPEDIDLAVALQSIKGQDKKTLQHRARSLGAKKPHVDKLSILELKIYIVQKSVSSEHIVFEELGDVIKKHDRGNWIKRTKEPPPGPSNSEKLFQKPETTIQELRKDVGLDD